MKATIDMHLAEAAQAILNAGRHLDAVRVHLDGAIVLPPGISMKEAQRVIIETTIAAQGGNKAEAARVLRIARRSIYDRLGKQAGDGEGHEEE